MNIIVLGPQGSGKGTQAEMLAKKYNLEHIDMGKTLREVAKADTPLGKEIYAIQNMTKTLVPSRILRAVLQMSLQSLPREQDIVFDGVPRKVDQMEYIEEAMQEVGRKISKVFFVKISEAESIERISKRWICEKCHKVLIMGKDVQSPKEECPVCGGKIMQRADDTPEGVKKRLAVFKEETEPVLEVYRKKGILIEIDGEQPIEKVFTDIVQKYDD